MKRTGLFILYDQAMEGMILPMVDTVTNAFIPFSEAATASAARKKCNTAPVSLSRNRAMWSPIVN